jgi:hypothetical protein
VQRRQYATHGMGEHDLGVHSHDEGGKGISKSLPVAQQTALSRQSKVVNQGGCASSAPTPSLWGPPTRDERRAGSQPPYSGFGLCFVHLAYPDDVQPSSCPWRLHGQSFDR